MRPDRRCFVSEEFSDKLGGQVVVADAVLFTLRLASCNRSIRRLLLPLLLVGAVGGGLIFDDDDDDDSTTGRLASSSETTDVGKGSTGAMEVVAGASLCDAMEFGDLIDRICLKQACILCWVGRFVRERQ
jgi:hypothetical protein